MIPSIIHQIWLNDPIDKRAIPYMNIAKTKVNDYKLWTDKNIWKEFGITRDKFSKYWKIDYDNVVGLSDILRIMLVKNYGGWYLDCDIELLKSLDEYQNHDFVTNTFCSTPQIHKDRVVNIINRLNDMHGFPRISLKVKIKIRPCEVMGEFFGAIKNHPFFDIVINEMEKRKNTEMHWTDKFSYKMFGEMITENMEGIKFLDGSESSLLLTHHLFKSWVEKKD